MSKIKKKICQIIISELQVYNKFDMITIFPSPLYLTIFASQLQLKWTEAQNFVNKKQRLGNRKEFKLTYSNEERQNKKQYVMENTK